MFGLHLFCKRSLATNLRRHLLMVADGVSGLLADLVTIAVRVRARERLTLTIFAMRIKRKKMQTIELSDDQFHTVINALTNVAADCDRNAQQYPAMAAAFKQSAAQYRAVIEVLENC